jgi:hypothetical protein
MKLRDLLAFLDDAQARRKGVRIWFALVLLWSVVRSLVVTKVFHQYGLNPALYFAIDFLSSIPYAHASAQSLLAYIDKRGRQSIAWAAVAAVAFYLPDIYILWASKEVPPATYLGFGLVLAVLTASAYWQWKEKRR